MTGLDSDTQFLILLVALAIPVIAAVVQLMTALFGRQPPLTKKALTEAVREAVHAAVNAALDAQLAQVRAAILEARRPSLAERMAEATASALQVPAREPATLPPVPAPNGHEPLLEDGDDLREALAVHGPPATVATVAAEPSPASPLPELPPAETHAGHRWEHLRAPGEKANAQRAADAAANREELKDKMVEAFRTLGEATTLKTLAQQLGHSDQHIKRVLSDNKAVFAEHEGKWGLREWLARAP